ncbi:MAG TPA: portal protein, partial [Xanthobacteraceae bacterium]|nr:portal protein [Xanthobacteraceae bacterium]
RQLGYDFASSLMTSYPILCARELQDQIGTMLRPTAKAWFHNAPVDPGRENNDAKRWLEAADTIQRRAMYDKRSLFTKAAKQGDCDFAVFGQAALSGRLNRTGDALLHRCWHLRDMAWSENEDGEISIVWRKWKPSARDLKRIFGAKIHDKVDQILMQKRPLDEIECMHIVVDIDLYTGDVDGYDRGEDGNYVQKRRQTQVQDRKKYEYVSIFYDVQNNHVMEAIATWNKEYIIPRWQTVSGSQYAFSPATVAALPDARLLQAMTYTLLEAGEKVVNPPMKATIDAVKSDMEIFAGGTIWVDRDYDEKTGAALEPLNIDAKGMPLGVEMAKDCRLILMQAFYLNKLNLPQRAPEMTAYEVGQRIQEYIRGALPIFEPLEMEYNGAICEIDFELLRRHGAFGSPFDMPKSLQGAELQFRFESPLHDAIEAQKGQKFLEMGQFIAQAVQLDPSAAAVPDAITALRDVMLGVGVPAKWVRSEISVAQIQAQAAQAQAAQQRLALFEQGSKVVGNLAAASKDSAAAGVAGAPQRPVPSNAGALAAP